MSSQNNQMPSGAAPLPSGSSSPHAVHILYDYATLPCESSNELNDLLARVTKLSTDFGTVSSFVLVLPHSHSFSPAHRKVCSQHAVTLEEIPASDPSSETFLLTRLLRLTLQLQASTAAIHASAAAPNANSTLPRTSMIILSSHASLTSSLSLMRNSGLFANLVLIHSNEASQDLLQSVSASCSMQQFMAGQMPKKKEGQQIANTGAFPTFPPFNAFPAPIPSPSPHPIPPNRMSGSGLLIPPAPISTTIGSSSPSFNPSVSFRPSQLSTSPSEEFSSSMSFAGLPSTGGSSAHVSPSQMSAGVSPQQALLPTPPYAQTSAAAARFLAQPIHAAISPVYSKSGKQMAMSAPNSPTHRAFFPANSNLPLNATHSPSHMHSLGFSQTQQLGQLSHPYSFHRGSSDRSTYSHSSSMANSARTRACLAAYSRIIAYCEAEKLIPRESVLKKRLVDSKLEQSGPGQAAERNATAASISGIDFEEFLSTIVTSGVGIMEGETPQRIVWPRGPDGQARKFACADFFCFPSEDHQILTQQGFMLLKQVKQYFKQHDTLMVACPRLNEETGEVATLEYVPITASELLVKKGTFDHVAITDETNNISLVPTNDHHMWTCTSKGSKWKMIAAESMMKYESVQVETSCREGVQIIDPANQNSLNVMSQLQLADEQQLELFLELYGVWLVHGLFTMSEEMELPQIAIQAKSTIDYSRLEFLFEQLDLPVLTQTQLDGTTLFMVEDEAWCKYFANETCASEPSESSESASAKSMWKWALTSLTSNQLRCIFNGINVATGCSESQASDLLDGDLLVASTSIRDEYVVAGIRAGLSVTTAEFDEGSSEQSNTWLLHYTNQDTQPVLKRSNMQMQSKKGTVWCVSVPTPEHLIIVRRIIESKGELHLNTSRPVICGNCPVSRLTHEQNAELLEFLYAVQPEVERGRFGFANWLANHGPPFVRLLAHGVLVELVQLLLNRKVLLFRKGKVSVASRSEASEAANLGMLFSAGDFQTPAVSRPASPSLQGVQATGNAGTISRPHSPSMASSDASAAWEDDTWRGGVSLTQPSSAGVDRSLLRSNLYRQGQGPSGAQRFTVSSHSVPATRAVSPMGAAPHDLRGRGAPILSERRSSGTLYDAPAAAAAADLTKSLWSKDGSTSSGFNSRRESLGGDGDYLRSTLPFESSTGYVGESVDACDPAAVLAVKLAQVNQHEISASTQASTDELARFTAAVQYRPCFHFEKSGAAHTPEWVCLVNFNIGTRGYQLRSSVHSKKDQAKNEVCMKVLQMLEDESIKLLAPVTDAAREGDTIDSVVDLARLLTFLQQAPVVYYLTRATNTNQPPMPPMDRFRRGYPMAQSAASQMWNGSARIQVKSVNVLTGEAQPTVSASTPFSHTATAATKFEVKEVIASMLLMQIQRAKVVNATLFSVLSAARHNLATAGMQQLSIRDEQLRNEQQSAFAHANRRYSMPPAFPVATTTNADANDSILWHPTTAASLMAPFAMYTSLDSGNNQRQGTNMPMVPPVQLNRLQSNNASFFNLHTPVPGHAFSGISAIGIQTPSRTPQDSHDYAPPSVDPMNQPSLLRTVSEVQNDEEAELTSKASAEKALQEYTPKEEIF